MKETDHILTNSERTYNIIGKRKIWYILSFVLLLPGIVSLFVWGLNVGIDFKGGTLQQLKFTENRPTAEQVRKTLSDANLSVVSVQTSEKQDVLIRFAEEKDVVPRDKGNAIVAAFKDQKAEEVSFENMGGSVAKSTTTKAVWAVVITAIALIIFIAWAFGSVPQPASSWRFGVSAILALAHDILFVIGTFSIVGHFIPSIEIDSLFITAILTILGFSVNDTIVVFDRIRENLRRNPGRTFEEIANISLNQTLVRSINTSMTVLIVLSSLLLLGGASIRNFVLALTLGVFIGTYSSIFNASPILVSWQGWVDRKTQKIKK